MMSPWMKRTAFLAVALAATACGSTTGADGTIDENTSKAATDLSSPTSALVIEITPSSGPLASTVTVVSGQGFAPHEQVAIYKNTRPFFAYTTDGSGSFVGAAHPMIGPAPASGIMTITATGRQSGRTATTTFTVTK